MNGDGKDDLVATETSTGKLFLYRGHGDGTIDGGSTRVEIGSGGWNGISDYAGGDFDGDGTGDLAAVESQPADRKALPLQGHRQRRPGHPHGDRLQRLGSPAASPWPGAGCGRRQTMTHITPRGCGPRMPPQLHPHRTSAAKPTARLPDGGRRRPPSGSAGPGTCSEFRLRARERAAANSVTEQGHSD